MRWKSQAFCTAALAASLVGTLPVHAQIQNDPAYQAGMHDAQEDREHHRDHRDHDDDRFRDDRSREAYRAGYEAGMRGGNGYVNAPYGNNGYNGGYDQYRRGGNPAAQVGFQDGVNDGRQDRQTGHSDRPTGTQAYRHADHNYSEAYGSRDQYKDEYRQAYTRGYQEGYNGGGDRDRFPR